MPSCTERKTIRAGILKYAQEMRWTYVPRAEAEARRGFDLDRVTREARRRYRPFAHLAGEIWMRARRDAVVRPARECCEWNGSEQEQEKFHRRF